MENENKKRNKVAYTIGQTVGVVFVGCLAACACGLMIGLSVKFLMWIF